MSHKVLGFLALLLVLAGAAGCGSTADGPAATVGPLGTGLAAPRSTATNCLESLRTAYERRDIYRYSSLFMNRFRFEFDPRDRWLDPTIPESWGLADELVSADHMFFADQVDSVRLSFDQSAPVPSTPEYPGTWKIVISNLHLRIYRHGPIGTPIMEVNGGGGTFYLQPIRASDEGEGGMLWKILAWTDTAPAQPSPTLVRPNSWGIVKLLYR